MIPYKDQKIYYSFDIEDYFMANCFDKQISVESWDNLPQKITTSFNILIDILDQKNIKATLFFLGYVAKKYPRLVKKAKSKGHEIASHGYSHRLVFTQSPKDFKSDIDYSTKLLEDLSGEKILGYRAPSFSLDITDKKYTSALIANGIKYDSSVFPFRLKSKTKNNLSEPYFIENNLLEIPLSTHKIFGLKFPIGGAYFRLYPTLMNNFLFKRHLKKENLIFYLHPWELIDEHPIYPQKAFLKFKHKYNIGQKTNQKLIKIPNYNNGLMKDFVIE